MCFQLLLPQQRFWDRPAITMFYAAMSSANRLTALGLSWAVTFVSTWQWQWQSGSLSRAACVNIQCRCCFEQCGLTTAGLMPCRVASNVAISRHSPVQYDIATWLFPTIRSLNMSSSPVRCYFLIILEWVRISVRVIRAFRWSSVERG